MSGRWCCAWYDDEGFGDDNDAQEVEEVMVMEMERTQTNGFMNWRWIPHALSVCRIAHFVILASEA